jgi:4-phospho-D-threonate 3-dehydrogenase / 4-phospho-D-erythronate 3-dehydrogenase
MGDPAGIGPELCLRALREPAVLAHCVPVLFGDAGVLERVRAQAPESWRFTTTAGKSKTRTRDEPQDEGCRVVSLAEWEKLGTPGAPVIVDCAAIDAGKVEPGTISAACGQAAFICIQQAIASAMAGRIAGVVTAPIHKQALRLAGVPYPGHTEIFTALTGARRSCMMLYSDVLTVSMVTTHIGYAEVPQKLSAERVLEVIELTAEARQQMLGRPARLGVCGLNPHAGEQGLFGQREEERHVQPAVLEARLRGLAVEGPLPPDAAFTSAQRKRFDAIVTLYHDQGHIPFKLLAFETGVNITLGLPIIRTSVDHGTAFDIAWKGRSDPQSLFAAIHAAAGLSRGRKQPETVPI